MIVTNVESGWEIVFQPSHGLLAGLLADHFAPWRQGPFWFETKAAITAHDDQKMRFKKGSRNYLTESGAPKDFSWVSKTAKKRFKEVSRRLKTAYRKHRWVGLLESLHAEQLYGSQSVSDSLADLLQAERKHRKQTLKGLSLKQSDLRRAYDTLRWCDRCSLILCQSALPTMQRRLEIITCSDDVRFDVHQRDDETVGVEPWPFGRDEFTASVEVRKLEQLTFEDDAELGKAIADCDPEIREWRFTREDSPNLCKHGGK